jgi:hypothetical protein
MMNLWYRRGMERGRATMALREIVKPGQIKIAP